MKISFGTLATVLSLCRQDGISKLELLNAMVRSVDRDCTLTGNAVTHLLHCESNLPNGKSNSLGNVKAAAREADKAAVVQRFSSKVLPMLREELLTAATTAICQIIIEDDSVGDGTTVELVTGLRKIDLSEQEKLNLAEFLAGTLLFAVGTDNKIGREESEQAVAAFENAQSSGNKPTLTRGTVAVAISKYFAQVKEKYSNLKTLLYYNEPRPIYSFYVPNYVSQPVRHTPVIHRDTTVKAIADISNYLIIDGVGGLGKSMMMRHFLLNSIDCYADFKRLPVLMLLKDYDVESDLVDFIHASIAVFSEHITHEMLVTALKNGQCLLLFDGFDEIDGARSQRFESEIERLTDRYPDNKYIISSRPFQSFVGLSRFTSLKLQPLTHDQAIALVDKLDFRPDAPEIKQKFMAQLKSKLYSTHRAFVETPLLLTLMLLTFERFASIPMQMHVFYRQSVMTLSETHDASKGFKRAYRSGLNSDGISDYFSEFSFRTYKDAKFEFSDVEFERYFNELLIAKRNKDKLAVRAADFAHDVAVNLCLMLLDGNKYHYTHRSFQEYFCALFFAKQDSDVQRRLTGFFESRTKRMRGDQTFSMLYDMDRSKVEKNIITPFLQGLFDKCDAELGYRTFLELMYPTIAYERGDIQHYTTYTPQSFLFGFLVETLKPQWEIYCDELPGSDRLLVEEYGYVRTSETVNEYTSLENVYRKYPWLRDDPEPVGWRYCFTIDKVYSSIEYEDIVAVLENDDFVFKVEYNAAKAYLDELIANQAERSAYFGDIF